MQIAVAKLQYLMAKTQNFHTLNPIPQHLTQMIRQVKVHEVGE